VPEEIIHADATAGGDRSEGHCLSLRLPAVLGAVVGIWALGRYSHVANEVSRDTALRTADLAEAVKTQIMRNAYMTLRAMAGFQRVASRNAKDCNDVAYFFLKNTNGYVNVGSFLPDGIFYCAAVPSTLNFNARGLDWFDAAVTNGNFTMGGYHVSDITRSGVIVFALPVRDEAGKVSQVLTLEADIEYISKILTFPNLPEETSLTVIDQFGNVLVASPDIGTRPGDNIAQWDVARTAMTADAPIVTEWKGPDGATRLFAATSSRVSDVAIPGADRADIRAFSIIVGIPAQRITSAIMGPAQTAGAAVGVVFAIILVGIYLFIRHTLVKPVKEIQLAAERLTFGDPTARVTRKSYAGEIRTLANAFNVMATTLARRSLISKCASSISTKPVSKSSAPTASIRCVARSLPWSSLTRTSSAISHMYATSKWARPISPPFRSSTSGAASAGSAFKAPISSLMTSPTQRLSPSLATRPKRSSPPLSLCKHKRWNPSGASPAAWPMTSTTC